MAEVEAISHATSPFTRQLYGVVHVTREWEMAGSSFYDQLRIAAQPERALRLMRHAHLLAPSCGLPNAKDPHSGTIITERPNEVWASDHTLTATIKEGQVTVFVAVDHCTTECVGLHAAKKATRFEALEPLRQAVRDYCGGFCAGAAAVGIR